MVDKKHSYLLVNLFYLVTHADEDVSAKEFELGLIMAEKEGLGVENFKKQLADLAGANKNQLIESSVEVLRKLSHPEKINILAWTAVAANSDGFMSAVEWALIYRIYHTELGLKLNEIMDRQKEIHREIYNRSFVAMGVRVND